MTLNEHEDAIRAMLAKLAQAIEAKGHEGVRASVDIGGSTSHICLHAKLAIFSQSYGQTLENYRYCYSQSLSKAFDVAMAVIASLPDATVWTPDFDGPLVLLSEAA